MNDLLEAKLTITRIKTKLLDLTGELIADNSAEKDYAIKRILDVIEYIDEHNIKISDVRSQ